MKADVELDVLFAPYAVTVEGLTNRQSLTLGSRRTLFIGQGEKHLVSAAEDTAFLLLIGLQSPTVHAASTARL